MLTRWAIDFDGCLIDSHGGIVDRINERFDTGYTRDMMTDVADFWNNTVLKPHRDWGWGEYCFDNEKFLRRVEPMPGVIDTIQLLLRLRHPVFIVTDRPNRHVAWVARYLATLDVIAPVLSTEDFDMEKSKLIDALQVNVAAEDSIEQAHAYVSHTSVSKILLVHRPWNAPFYCADPIERVFDWSEIAERIREESTDDLPSA